MVCFTTYLGCTHCKYMNYIHCSECTECGHVDDGTPEYRAGRPLLIGQLRCDIGVVRDAGDEHAILRAYRSRTREHLHSLSFLQMIGPCIRSDRINIEEYCFGMHTERIAKCRFAPALGAHLGIIL